MLFRSDEGVALNPKQRYTVKAAMLSKGLGQRNPEDWLGTQDQYVQNVEMAMGMAGAGPGAMPQAPMGELEQA